MKFIRRVIFRWLFADQFVKEAERAAKIREKSFDNALSIADSIMKRRLEDDGIYAAGFAQALYNQILTYS